MQGACIPNWPGTSVWGWSNPRLSQTGRLSGAEDRSWPRWPCPIVTSSGVIVAVCLGQFNILLLGIMTSTPPLPPLLPPCSNSPLLTHTHTHRTSMHKRREVAVLSFALDFGYILIFFSFLSVSFEMTCNSSCLNSWKDFCFYLIVLKFRFPCFVRARQNEPKHLTVLV